MSVTCHIVDSNGWIEHFTNGEGADNFAPAIRDIDRLIVRAIMLFEVARHLLRWRGETQAKAAVAQLSSVRIEVLNGDIACDAAVRSIEHRLPMADSIVYATARRFDALLWTQNIEFEGLPGVGYLPKVMRP